jgi:hypothetical protein
MRLGNSPDLVVVIVKAFTAPGSFVTPWGIFKPLPG